MKNQMPKLSFFLWMFIGSVLLMNTPVLYAQQEVSPVSSSSKVRKFTQNEIARLALLATKNAESQKVMMGSYVPNSPASYNRRAGTEYTYYELANWDSLYQQVGRDYEEMWKIGKRFMDNQLKQKKIFYFSHDPNHPRSRGFLRELWYLQKKKKGVRFIQEGDALWKAVW